jgi:hypothetical protein
LLVGVNLPMKYLQLTPFVELDIDYVAKFFVKPTSKSEFRFCVSIMTWHRNMFVGFGIELNQRIYECSFLDVVVNSCRLLFISESILDKLGFLILLPAGAVNEICPESEKTPSKILRC